MENNLKDLVQSYLVQEQLNQKLPEAISTGNIPLIQELLEQGANPNYKGADECTLVNIIYTPPAYQLPVLQLLLKYGTNPNYCLGDAFIDSTGCLLNRFQAATPNREELRAVLQKAGALMPISFPIGTVSAYSRGKRNPDKINNDFYQYAITSGESAYQLKTTIRQQEKKQLSKQERKHKKKFRQLGMEQTVPDKIWNYHRFGNSKTVLPDGNLVLIGGEHEDYYDEDFCIFNDVVKINTDGTMELYFYSEKVFPPTDFHTATLVGNTIYIIGGLGYQGQRIMDQTPVFALDLTNFTITPISTKGDKPGWIYKHQAFLDATQERIVLFGGKYSGGRGNNEAIFGLDLKKRHWIK